MLIPPALTLMAWSTPLRKLVTSGLGGLALLGGAVKATAEIYPYAEPLWYAHRSYVRSLVSEAEKRIQTAEEKTLNVLRDLQIEQAEGKRDATASDLTKWRIEYEKSGDRSTKEIIGRQIETLDGTRQKLDDQIRTLNRLRGQ